MDHSDPVLSGRALSIGFTGRPVLRGCHLTCTAARFWASSGRTAAARPRCCGRSSVSSGRCRAEWERQAGLTIGYAPQRDRIDTMLPVTALEVVLMGRAAQAGPFQRVRRADIDAALHALDLLGARSLDQQLFRNLSGGQQQRVLLARALAADPDLLVFDEPTAGMDAASEAAVLEFFRNLHRTHGVTILIVTHMLPTSCSTSPRRSCSWARGRFCMEPWTRCSRRSGCPNCTACPGAPGHRRTVRTAAPPGAPRPRFHAGPSACPGA